MKIAGLKVACLNVSFWSVPKKILIFHRIFQLKEIFNYNQMFI